MVLWSSWPSFAGRESTPDGAARTCISGTRAAAIVRTWTMPEFRPGVPPARLAGRP